MVNRIILNSIDKSYRYPRPLADVKGYGRADICRFKLSFYRCRCNELLINQVEKATMNPIVRLKKKG